MKGATLRRALLIVVVLSASVKSYSNYASTLDSPELMPQTIARGEAHAPNQYRALVPLLWTAATDAGIAPGTAEKGIVVFSILLCYAVLATVMYRASRNAPMTALCLLAFYGASVSGFWFRNRDQFFEVAFTAAGMALAVQRRPRWGAYAVLSAIAALNRETWLFSLAGAGVARWFDAGTLHTFLQDRRRDLAGLVAASVVAVVVLGAVRAYYGVRPYHYGLWQFTNNVKLLLIAGSFRASIGQAVWFAGSGIFIVWLIFATVRRVRHVPFVLGFTGPLFAVSFLISNWAETRIFVPAYAVLLISINAALRDIGGSD